MILYRYIVKEHMLPFLYSFLVVVFIFTMQLAVQLLRKILYKGLDWAVVSELFLIQMAWMVVLAVPMAVLVSSLMAFGKMSADNEIMAIKASGQNLVYLLTPVISAGCVLTVIMIFFHNNILPDANHKASNLMSDISRKKPAAMIEPGILIKDFQNYSILVDKVNTKEGTLKGVRIFSDIQDEDPATTVADSGRLLLTKDEKYLQLDLYNGETHSKTVEEEQSNFYLARFKRQVIYIPNVDSELKRTERQYRGDREKSSKDLLADVEKFRENHKNYLNRHNKSIDDFKAKIVSIDSLRYDTLVKEKPTLDSIKNLEQWFTKFAKRERNATRTITRKQKNSERFYRQATREKKRINQFLVEVHKKFSISFACIVFLLIGAPLGIMAKKGGFTVGISYSIFFFILFWALLILGESTADNLRVNPALAMWMPNIILGIFGIIIILKMVKETTFINYKAIISVFKKILPKKKVPYHISVSTNFILRLPNFIMNKTFGYLSAYLIKAFFKNLLTIVIGLIVIFVVIDYVANHKLMRQGDLQSILLYYYYYLYWFTGIISPIGALLASMFAMGGLVKNSELTAMKAAGLSVRKLTIPMLLIGILLSGFNFYLFEKIQPEINAKRMELMDDIKSGNVGERRKEKAQVRDFRRDFYYFGNPQTSYFFEEFRTKPQNAKNIRREIFTNNRIIQRIEAKEMIFNVEDTTWSFINGAQYNFNENGSFAQTTFDTLQDNVLKAVPEEMTAKINKYTLDYLSYWQLKNNLEKVKQRGEDASRYEADLHYKIAQPFVNFIVIIVGLSIAAMAGKKGGALNFGIGLVIIFAYWILSQLLLALGKGGSLDPQLAAWAGNIIFLIVGIYLYKRTSF